MFIVLEAQTNKNGVLGTLINQYNDYNQAESKYYAILSAAAVSSLPRHAAFILTNEGMFVKGDCYTHEDPDDE